MMRQQYFNKRGDIPITILVVGVLALCLLTIFSFYTSSQNVKAGFAGIDVVEEVKLMKEKIDFYGELGFDEKERKEMFNINFDTKQNINFISLTRSGISVRYNLQELNKNIFK